MGDPVVTGKIVAAQAWRATMNDEESRAYLQSRLIALSSLMFWSFVAFLTYVTVLYQVYPGLEPAHNAIIFVAADGGLVLLSASWRVLLVRKQLSVRTLRGIDSFYAFGTGALLAFGAYMASDFKPAPYSCLLFTSLIVLTRAIMIPSSGRRTIVMSTLAFVPFGIAGFGFAFLSQGFTDLPAAAAICSVVLVCAVVASLAANGSQTLYGLRQRANAATQLGQYTLDEKIGEGGMGVVYRAHHVLLRRPTAVKLLQPDRIGADTIDRFEREVQHMSQLTHPNTVAVYDFGRSYDGVFYYAMEYLDGIDLQALVTKFGPQPADRVIDILVQVCGAVQEAHRHDMIHRDIKPANILLCERGGMLDVAKVVDFGLVKKISSTASDAADPAIVRALTVDSQRILGTPGFLAPEAVTTPQAIGAAVDIYALGAVAYFLITGRRVFEGGTAIAICLRHVTEQPVPPSQIASVHVPRGLEDIIMRCLAKSPADRPASATDLANELRRIPRSDDWDDAKARAWWASFRAGQAPATAAAEAPLTIEVDLAERVPTVTLSPTITAPRSARSAR
jgi:eukaryotic-like serine/threonine-protein kinase